jgi:hypothetical protein
MVAGALGVPGVAFAQTAAPSAEEIKKAGESFDLGKRSYRNEEWVEAAEHFEAADMAAPSGAALELALRSRDRADQLDRAATLAALALSRNADQPKLVKLAKEVLKKADKELFKTSVSCNEPCDLVVDSKLVHGRAATERTVYLNPGQYTLRAAWPGDRSESESVKATKGGSTKVSFKAPAEKPTEPTPTPATTLEKQPEAGPTTQQPMEPPKAEPSSGWSPVVFWIGTGLTVAAGAATAWSGIDTQNNPGADRVREECAGQGESCDLYQEGLDKQRRTNILAGVTAGVGVVTILIGLFATDWGGSEKAADSRPAPKRAGIEPWIGVGQGAAIGAEGRF